MDFVKVKTIVKNQAGSRIFLDIDNADIHELRVAYSNGNEKTWTEFTPENYKSEEELAETILARG